MSEHLQRRQNSWFWRRAMAYIMTAFCMSMLTWLALNGRDGELHILIATGSYYLLGAIFAIYVAGATFEDIITLVKGVRGVPQQVTEK